jgi:hypothetical protein
MVSHQIPISDLYKLEKSWSNSEENIFCAVQIKIADTELQTRFIPRSGRYLLQVWTKTGQLIYSKILEKQVHTCNINGNYLVFVTD